MANRKLKRKKWYPATIKPDVTSDLIVMTDMGYIFEAVYENDKFLVSIVKNYKVYFEEWMKQYSIVKWMKI